MKQPGVKELFLHIPDLFIAVAQYHGGEQRAVGRPAGRISQRQ